MATCISLSRLHAEATFHFKSFQKQNAKDTRRLLVAPSAVMLEDAANKGVFHFLVTKEQKLPTVVTREIKTAANQSTIALRIFVGNSTAIEDRMYLSIIGFMGVTGFDVKDPTSFDLKLAIDENGIMTMSATDRSGKLLSIGPTHAKTVTRKIFEPTYKTMR
jgi:molecular chaperone DnaK (HSP70)